MNPEPKEFETVAEYRVLDKYAKLYKDLMQLTAALQKLEPIGTFVDEATFKRKKDGTMRIMYKARPVQLVIEDGGRRFTLRVQEMKQ